MLMFVPQSSFLFFLLDKIKLYCKGADTVIMERLAPRQLFTQATIEHLEQFALEGLRTLCVAVREIPPAEYADWNVFFTRASTTILNRQQELDNAAELIERNMFLLGATAIEDRLQVNVPDTIRLLMEASIKIWVLTGDRQETAVNIGYSCKLLNEEMTLIVCNETTHFETKEFLETKLLAIKGYGREAFEEDEEYALIIDGKSLEYALESDIKFTLLDLARRCKSVICCRVSPLQKVKRAVKLDTCEHHLYLVYSL
jgi:phospholipid-transporting ATPase